MKITNQGKNLIISDFDEIEALRLAMKLEADGIKYYSELSSKTKSEDVKKILRQLIEEEEKHAEKFKAWLEETIRQKGLDVEADRGDEEGPFDFIDTGVFGDIWDVEKTLSSIKSDIDALSLGEWAELNSINFYKAILEKSGNEKGKTILKGIIKEEQNHLKTFARYKELLEKKKAA
jgi:rubrerythrin